MLQRVARLRRSRWVLPAVIHIQRCARVHLAKRKQQDWLAVEHAGGQRSSRAHPTTWPRWESFQDWPASPRTSTEALDVDALLSLQLQQWAFACDYLSEPGFDGGGGGERGGDGSGHGGGHADDDDGGESGGLDEGRGGDVLAGQVIAGVAFWALFGGCCAVLCSGQQPAPTQEVTAKAGEASIKLALMAANAFARRT